MKKLDLPVTPGPALITKHGGNFYNPRLSPQSSTNFGYFGETRTVKS